MRCAQCWPPAIASAAAPPMVAACADRVRVVGAPPYQRSRSPTICLVGSKVMLLSANKWVVADRAFLIQYPGCIPRYMSERIAFCIPHTDISRLLLPGPAACAALRIVFCNACASCVIISALRLITLLLLPTYSKTAVFAPVLTRRVEIVPAGSAAIAVRPMPPRAPLYSTSLSSANTSIGLKPPSPARDERLTIWSLILVSKG